MKKEREKPEKKNMSTESISCLVQIKETNIQPTKDFNFFGAVDGLDEVSEKLFH